MSEKQEQAEEQYPIFVYGTLRPGADRYDIVRRFVEEEGVHPAIVGGYQIYKCGHFPGAVKEDTQIYLRGEVLYINPKNYQEALKRLDRYEAVGFLFNRILVTAKLLEPVFGVDVTDINISCWLYELKSDVIIVERKDAVPHNDWLARG